jgi:hypothetical protein
MNKSATLFTSALLALGLAAGAMAADSSKAVAQTSADAPAAASAGAAKTAKPAKPAKKSSKKSSHAKKKSSTATTK